MIGQPCEIGDMVVFNPPSYKGLTVGEVMSFTPKGMRVRFRQGKSEDITTQMANRVVVLTPQQMESYRLKTIQRLLSR